MTSRLRTQSLALAICGWLIGTGLAGRADAGGPPSIIYVDAQATGPIHDGTTWCSAYLMLDAALAAADSGDTIRMADGIYTPDDNLPNPRQATFALVSGVRIEGGYAGCGAADPNERDLTAHPTILSGDLNGDDQPGFVNITENAYRVVTAISVNASTELNGLVITGGNANSSASYGSSGGGLYSNMADLKITDCRFRSNAAAGGAAWFMLNGSPTVLRCVFEDNRADHTGGAVYCADDVGVASPVVIGCLFRRNHCTAQPGGWGGAWHNEENADTVIVNSIFIGNQAAHGGAISGGDTNHLHLLHCCIVGNTGLVAGGGLYSGLGDWFVDHCVIWNNQDPSGATEPAQVRGFFFPAGEIMLRYCDVQSWSGVMGGVANFGFDPQFVDADGPDNLYGTDDDNLHLLPTSPCIESGDPAFTIIDPLAGLDLDDQPRITGCRVDRGIDEFFPVVPHSGDFDANGDVGPEDVSPFVVALLASSTLGQCVADLNLDNRLDGLDIQFFVTALLQP